MKINRLGWVCEKIGMTTIFENKKAMAVTLLKVFKQNVISRKNEQDHVVLRVGVEAFGKLKSKPQVQELKKLDKPMCKEIREFKISLDSSNLIDEFYGIELLKSEKFVDVTAVSAGKGFSGGMKLWNFQGAQASHGNSLAHRAIGSTGVRDKNWKGKKMPGRMGGKNVTTQNLKVCMFDDALSVVALAGSVPGKKNSLVVLRQAIKKQEVRA